MKRKVLFVGLLALALAVAGCASLFQQQSGQPSTMPVAQVATVTYEGVALGLNTAKAYIKGQEVSKQLVGPALDEKIADWEKARQLFLQAGDALKASIAAKDARTTQQKFQAYNDLLQKAAFEVGKLEAWKGGTK